VLRTGSDFALWNPDLPSSGALPAPLHRRSCQLPSGSRPVSGAGGLGRLDALLIHPRWGCLCCHRAPLAGTAARHNTGDGKTVRRTARGGSGAGGAGGKTRVVKSGAGRGNWGTEDDAARAAEGATSAEEAVTVAKTVEGGEEGDRARRSRNNAPTAEDEAADTSVTYDQYLKARKREGEAFEERAVAAVDTSSGAYKGLKFIAKEELTAFENVADGMTDGRPAKRANRRRDNAREDVIDEVEAGVLGFVTDASDLPRDRAARGDGERRGGGRGGGRGRGDGEGRRGGRGGDGERRGGGRGGDGERRGGGRGGGRGRGDGEGRRGGRGGDGEGRRGGRGGDGERRGGGRGGGRGGARAEGAPRSAAPTGKFPGLSAIA
jgi:hypothetical protein